MLYLQLVLGLTIYLTLFLEKWGCCSTPSPPGSDAYGWGCVGVGVWVCGCGVWVHECLHVLVHCMSACMHCICACECACIVCMCVYSIYVPSKKQQISHEFSTSQRQLNKLNTTQSEPLQNCTAAEREDSRVYANSSCVRKGADMY